MSTFCLKSTEWVLITVILIEIRVSTHFYETFTYFIDSVVRPHYYKYFHPKEALISGGVVPNKVTKSLISSNKNISSTLQYMEDKYKIEFVYPFGATMNVVAPSNVILTTGPVAYPFNRPIAGLFVNDKDGKILATGSGHMFADKYITHETNMSLWDEFMNLLLDKNPLASNDFTDIEIYDYTIIPDTIYLAEQPKICLVESLDCDIPSDFKQMFDMSLHSINNNLLRDVIGAYEKLDVKYEPLKIIKPQFEIPLPPLQLAVFQTVFSDLPPPPCELFDLDEEFSSSKAQITQLTNKCLASALSDDGKTSKPVNEKELEYFIQECGRVLNIFPDDQKWPAKDIVHYIGVRIAQYKKLDRD